MSKQEKILILIQNFNSEGGTEIAARNLLHALNEMGMPTAILAVEDYTGNEIEVTSLNRIGNAPRPQSALERLVGSRRYENAISEVLSKFCHSENYGTIINFTYENLSVLPYGSAIKTICVYHWSVRGYEKSLLKIASKKNLLSRFVSTWILKRDYNRLHRFIRKTDKAIVLTQAGQQELSELSPNSNSIVIPNFLTQESPDCVDFSIKNKKKAVFVGRLSKEKGVYHLLDIWEKIVSEIPDAHLDVYGDGNERAGMRHLIDSRGINGITLMGFEKDPKKIYADADILLCTSETEGFGMVLIEAMNYGVVPFAFDCPVSPKELIGDCGICVECFNCKQYATALAEVWQNKERLMNLAQKAFTRSLSFTKKEVLNKWIQLIREINTL